MMKSIEKKITDRNKILLWIGNWTSNAGNKIFDYANSILILSFGRNAKKIMALYQGSETAVTIFMNLLGGVAADGISKKKICVITDLLSSVICFVLAFMLDSPIIGIAVVLANAVLACVGAFNSPTYKSIIREVIEKDSLLSFNSVMHAVNETIGLVSPVIGLAMVKYIGVSGALLLDGFTFLLSAALEYCLKPLPGHEVSDIKRKNMIYELKEGMKYAVSNKPILFLLIMSSGINFFLAAYNLSLPFTENIIGEGYYSKLLIAEASGGILGSIVCNKLFMNSHSLKVMLICLGTAGVTLSTVSMVYQWTTSGACFIVLIALFTLQMTIYNIMFFTYVQMNIKQEYLGRIFSIINTLALLFVPLGTFVFSLILSFENLSSFFVSGVGVIIIAIVALTLSEIMDLRLEK